MSYIDFGVNFANIKKYSDTMVASLLTDAKNSGVTHVICISNSIKECKRNLYLAKIHPMLYFTAGIHPHNAKEFRQEDIEFLTKLATHPQCIAIGECGLDYNRNFSTKEQQIAAFEAQIMVAKNTNKKLYLHCRDSYPEFIEILNKHQYYEGLVHCFTGDLTQAQVFIKMGFQLGITGWLLDNRRNKKLAHAVTHIGIEHLIVETDSPWMPIYPAKFSVPQDVIKIVAEIERLKGQKCVDRLYQNAMEF